MAMDAGGSATGAIAEWRHRWLCDTDVARRGCPAVREDDNCSFPDPGMPDSEKTNRQVNWRLWLNEDGEQTCPWKPHRSLVVETRPVASDGRRSCLAKCRPLRTSWKAGSLRSLFLVVSSSIGPPTRTAAQACWPLTSALQVKGACAKGCVDTSLIFYIMQAECLLGKRFCKRSNVSMRRYASSANRGIPREREGGHRRESVSPAQAKQAPDQLAVQPSTRFWTFIFDLNSTCWKKAVVLTPSNMERRIRRPIKTSLACTAWDAAFCTKSPRGALFPSDDRKNFLWMGVDVFNTPSCRSGLRAAQHVDWSAVETGGSQLKLAGSPATPSVTQRACIGKYILDSAPFASEFAEKPLYLNLLLCLTWERSAT